MSIQLLTSRVRRVKAIPVKLYNTDYIAAYEDFLVASTPIENDKVQVGDIAVVIRDCQMILEETKDAKPVPIFANDQNLISTVF
ncbi:MAG: hypothetical protein RIF33_12305 [Cyclobacteriaceae bacterium]